MGRIRLIATDVDGTLLDPSGRITTRTRAAIRALSDEGVILALATARRWTGAVLAASDFDFRGPVIVFDGAVIRSYPDGEIIRIASLDRSVAQRTAHAMVPYGIQPIMQYSDAGEEFLIVADEAANPEWTATYLPAFREQIRYRPIAQLCDAAANPIRLVAFGPLGVLRRAAVDLASPDCGRQLLPTGNYGTAELTLLSSDATKGIALAALAARLGISVDETMAIGDGLNDISMLRVAGLGVAMGQAPRRVRASAQAVTTSNADDGLALAIERYVLGPGRQPTHRKPRRESPRVLRVEATEAG